MGVYVSKSGGASASEQAIMSANSADIAALQTGGGNVDVARLESAIALNAYNLAINKSVTNMIDGFTDSFADESGIDVAASAGQVFDLSGKMYTNPDMFNMVPAMTDYTAPKGIVTQSSEFSVTYLGWKAFNGSQGGTDRWLSVNSGVGLPQWVAYQFNNPKIAVGYVLYAGGGLSPTAWNFQGWTGAAWVNLDSQTGQSVANSAGTKYIISNTTAYIKYRLVITANLSGLLYTGLRRFDILGEQAITDMSLVSATQSAVTQPTSATVIFHIQDGLIAPILNTGLTAEVSRDGGVNWFAGTLSDVGISDGSERILRASVDLSTAAAGTSMRYRLKTLNQTSISLLGASLQWR